MRLACRCLDSYPVPDAAVAMRRSYPEVFSLVSRIKHVNLLRDWPGYQAKGSAFPRVEACAAAERMRRRGFYGRKLVILCGRRVAGVFGITDFRYFQPIHLAKRSIIVAPHPSGVNRWWNDPGNRTRAKTWMQSIGRLFSLELN